MNKFEEIVKVFMRLNGYFLVDNFIVHNGNANLPNCQQIIPQLTETDLLGIRLPHQQEIAGNLLIENFDSLILDNNLIDLIIIETKSGNSNKPNSTWKDVAKIENVKYLLRFFGFSNDSKVIDSIASALLSNYVCNWENYSIRFIMVSENPNKYYSDKGIKYLTFDSIIDFIIKVRGECWININMGIASHHSQWNPFMNHIFDIANDVEKTDVQRKELILNYLSQ